MMRKGPKARSICTDNFAVVVERTTDEQKDTSVKELIKGERKWRRDKNRVGKMKNSTSKKKSVSDTQRDKQHKGNM